MAHIAPLVAVILASCLLRCRATEATVLCRWTKVSSNQDVHYSFLRTSPSLRLYHSTWSAGERALLGCAWSDDAAVVREYFSACRQFSDHPDEHLNLHALLGTDESPCVSMSSPSAGERRGRRPVRSAGAPPPDRTEEGSRKRVKRGFIVPGTLWCGSGNKATSYADLGVFAETDSCCREHDQCKDTILSFDSNFGVFNSHIFTMSHCDCDNKFRSCLMEAEDSISDVVGYTFFNLLNLYCFEFSQRLQCTERNWFGMCNEMKMALYAELHPPTLYVTSSEIGVNQTNQTTGTTVSSPAQVTTITSISGSASTTLTASVSSTSPTFIPTTAGDKTWQKVTQSVPDNNNNNNELEVPMPTKGVVTSAYQPESSLSSGPTLPEQDTNIADKKASCDIYKDLDQCRYKILPQQKRFGLHNPEIRTLYHCNCTSRLFQNLAEQRRLSKVQALLQEHVSQSCFLPQECTSGKICTDALIKPGLPHLHQKGGTDMEGQRHPQEITQKLRKPNSKRAKRRDRAVRMHKLCLRMTRRDQNHQPEQRGTRLI
ncbi:group 3 secretory phospholipase A2 [Genypterus blacodes]|uniref:group 3 secretory phospholipase A2 n=1 Tax=Genypterus blacodes TaxID=154954 RepID=UPI003F771B9C